MAMLEVKNLSISFGGLKAVDDFNITIEKGQLYGLIGPNGAGKTTVFNLLTGVYKPDGGIILLDGKNIAGKKNIEINRAGVARTFQNIRLFKDLSVLDNVKVGLHNHHSYSTLTGIFRLPKYRKVEREMDEKALELLKAVSYTHLEIMEQEMGRVKTSQITYAVRNTSIDGREIHEGDIMGIGDSGMLAVGSSVSQTAMDALNAMVDDDSELITIYYGKSVKEEDADCLLYTSRCV